MERSLNLAALLIDHALAVFNLMERDPTIEDAAKILGWIRRHGQPTFTIRECFCAHQSRFKKVESIHAALHLLEEHAYIRQGAKQEVAHRPSIIYEVNPKELEAGA